MRRGQQRVLAFIPAWMASWIARVWRSVRPVQITK